MKKKRLIILSRNVTMADGICAFQLEINERKLKFAKLVLFKRWKNY